MILPILDYCGAVFHGCGKGNEKGLECLQRQGGRIALNTPHLSTEQIVTSLGWELLQEEEKTTLLNWLKIASREGPQAISPNILNLKDIIFMIMTLRT